MADEVDVETALVGVVTAALYPNGTGAPCAAGVPCTIFRGFPTTQAQELAKANNFVNVSVAARSGVERNVTAYPREWQTSVPPVHTLTATAAGNQVTIGGTAAVGQAVVVLGALAAASFAYAVRVGDTPASVAAGLAAAAVAAGYAGSSAAGATATIAGHPGILRVRIAATGTSVQEVKRQDKSFQISIWAPPAADPTQDADAYRSAVARLIDPALAARSFLDFPDGSCGFLRYERTQLFDLAQAEGLYRRDLDYWVEYPTLISETDTEVADVLANIAGGQAQDFHTIGIPAVPSNN